MFFTISSIHKIFKEYKAGVYRTSRPTWKKIIERHIQSGGDLIKEVEKTNSPNNKHVFYYTEMNKEELYSWYRSNKTNKNKV